VISTWDNDDFAKCGFGAHKVDVEEPQTLVRIICCHKEKWVGPASTKNNFANENLLQKKCGGLSFKDLDSKLEKDKIKFCPLGSPVNDRHERLGMTVTNGRGWSKKIYIAMWIQMQNSCGIGYCTYAGVRGNP
jgi:hypothetical protein